MSPTVLNRWRGGSAVAVPACPACSDTRRRLHASDVFDHLEGPASADRWAVWRCNSCRSLYTDPSPSDDSLAQAYAAYYTHEVDVAPKRSRLNRLMTALVNGYLNYRFKVSLRPASAFGKVLFACIEPLRLKLDYHGRHLFLARHGVSRRVLDVGAGNGEFLVRAREFGWHGVGLDPDPQAVMACSRQRLDVREGTIRVGLRADDEKFDVVTMRHSIEHVRDPRADIEDCLRQLKPGGMLWLAWPNPCGPGARLFRPTWRGLEVPRHLCIPSARAMQNMLLDAGFAECRILRRGHHARGISRESGEIARRRPGIVNRIRASGWRIEGLLANILATLHPEGGDELVVVAFSREVETPRA